jgi:hypothetical protein
VGGPTIPFRGVIPASLSRWADQEGMR